jgi:glycosyltransferase involved in cell wall biosynthesis
MKIFQLVTQMEAGGAQRVAYLLKTEFESRGYDSNLWFLYTKRPAYAGLSGVGSLMDHPPSALGAIKILFRLGRMIWTESPDVLITHTHYANVLCHLLSSVLGVRHRIAVQHNPTHSYPRAVRIADAVMGSIGFYSANVAVSKTVADSINGYPRFYRDRLTIAYNGVPEPPAPALRQTTRQRLDIPLDTPLLVNVGRFSVQKNQEFLIRLVAQSGRLHLLLVGDGELREQLHGLARRLEVTDRVHFTGEVKPDEVVSLIAAGDVFVLPSLFEAVGMVVLEAMMLGVPVMSNDIPSSHEFVGDDGVIVDIAAPQEWLSSIEALLEQPERAAAMAARARLKAKRFTITRMADAYEALMMPVGSQGLVGTVE